MLIELKALATGETITVENPETALALVHSGAAVPLEGADEDGPDERTAEPVALGDLPESHF